MHSCLMHESLFAFLFDSLVATHRVSFKKNIVMNDITLGLLDMMPNSFRYQGHESPQSDVTAQILQFIPKDAHVLDVGCSSGNLMRWIKELCNAQVYGIEANKYSAEVAIKRGFDVQCCTFEDYSPNVQEQFDVIIFADVLEHLINPGAALQKAHQLLKENGIVITSIPNIAHWTIRLNLLSGKFEYEPIGLLDATHLRWFTQKTLYRLFSKTNFKIESMAYSEGEWLPAYQTEVPWKWVNSWHRRKIIHNLVSIFPTLFACQFIVKASKILSPTVNSW